MEARLGQANDPGQLGRDRLLCGPLGAEPGRGRRRVHRRASPPSRRPAWSGSARSSRRRPPGRLVPAPVGIDDDLLGAGPGQPGAQRLAGRHLAKPQHEIGPDARWRTARRAAAGRRSRSRGNGRAARSTAGRSARRGSASRQTRARWARGSRSSGSSLATGDDHPGAGVADVLCDLLEHEFGGLQVERRNRGQRPHVASF